MDQMKRKIVIIGSGISGLCAAVYGLKCGYQVEVLEMHDMAGGLATSWRRGDYTFETCLHWLLGSKPGGELNADWREIFDIEKLTFVNGEEFSRIEDESGGSLSIYTDIDRLEWEMLRRAPKDESAIRSFAREVRNLTRFRMLDPSGGLAGNWLNLLRDATIFSLTVPAVEDQRSGVRQAFLRSAGEKLFRRRRDREAVGDCDDLLTCLDGYGKCRLPNWWVAGDDPAD